LEEKLEMPQNPSRDSYDLHDLVKELARSNDIKGYLDVTPLVLREIQRNAIIVFNGTMNTPGYRDLYARFGLELEDAISEVIAEFLSIKNGVRGHLLHKIYFEYPERHRETGREDYDLRASRKVLRKFITNIYKKKLPKSRADAILDRVLVVLKSPPFSTHDNGHLRRFTLGTEQFSREAPIPSPAQIRKATRLAAAVPKIRQRETAERASKIYATREMHLLTELIVQEAPGLTIDQLKTIIENILTEHDAGPLDSSDDMQNILENMIGPSTDDIQSLNLVRSIVEPIWAATGRNTKRILALQFQGWSDQRIADQVLFDGRNGPEGRSRAWVTTCFTNFAKTVSEYVADLPPNDQILVSRIIDGLILEFDVSEEEAP
jgi:hypothetical protein